MLFVPRFCSSAGRFSTSRAAADGLVDPLTVQVEQQIPPTDRQMDYALEFEAMIPDGVWANRYVLKFAPMLLSYSWADWSIMK